MGTDCTLRAFFELRVSTSCVGLQACVIHTNMGHIVMEPICASRFRENRSITRSHHCSGQAKLRLNVYFVPRLQRRMRHQSCDCCKRLLCVPTVCVNHRQTRFSSQGGAKRTNTRQVTWLYTVFFASFPEPQTAGFTSKNGEMSQVRVFPFWVMLVV